MGSRKGQISNEGHFRNLPSAIDLRRGLRIYPAVLGRCQQRVSRQIESRAAIPVVRRSPRNRLVLSDSAGFVPGASGRLVLRRNLFSAIDHPTSNGFGP